MSVLIDMAAMFALCNDILFFVSLLSLANADHWRRSCDAPELNRTRSFFTVSIPSRDMESFSSYERECSSEKWAKLIFACRSRCLLLSRRRCIVFTIAFWCCTEQNCSRDELSWDYKPSKDSKDDEIESLVPFDHLYNHMQPMGSVQGCLNKIVPQIYHASRRVHSLN